MKLESAIRLIDWDSTSELDVQARDHLLEKLSNLSHAKLEKVLSSFDDSSRAFVLSRVATHCRKSRIRVNAKEVEEMFEKFFEEALGGTVESLEGEMAGPALKKIGIATIEAHKKLAGRFFSAFTLKEVE